MAFRPIRDFARFEHETVVESSGNADTDFVDTVVDTSLGDAAEQAVEKSNTIVEVNADLAEDIDRTLAIYRYVKRYGVDNVLMTLQNYDGYLNGSVIEMCCTGRYSRDRAYEIAMESLGDKISDFWEWIKKMCRRIRDFLQELWAKFLNLFSNQRQQIKRLQRIVNKRVDKNHEDVEDIDLELVEIQNGSADIKVKIKDKNGKEVTIEPKDLPDPAKITADKKDDAITKYDAFIKKLDDGLSNWSDYMEKVLEKKTVSATNAQNMAKKYLAAGLEMLDGIKAVEAERKAAESQAKTYETSSKKVTGNDADSKAKIEVYKKAIELLNKHSSYMAKCLELVKRLVSAYISAASKLIAKGTVSKSK